MTNRVHRKSSVHLEESPQTKDSTLSKGDNHHGGNMINPVTLFRRSKFLKNRLEYGSGELNGQ